MIKTLLISIFGSYEPVSYLNGDVSVIPSGASGVDWAWVSGVCLFGLTLYCLFRLLGGIVKK